MSKKTWTGKGSKSRVENKKQYDDNYDKIFKKNKKSLYMNNKKVLDSNMKYQPGLIDGPNKKYDKIYQQLEALLEDKDYWVADTGYALFLKQMMNKIIAGKRITSKIDDALVKAVKSYESFLYPSEVRKQRIRILVKPIDKCIALLNELNDKDLLQRHFYMRNKKFLKSVKASAKAYENLTNKQKVTMNKKYKYLLEIKKMWSDA